MSFDSPWMYLVLVVVVAAGASVFGVHRNEGGFPFGDKYKDSWQTIAVVLGLAVVTFVLSGATGFGEWLKLIFGSGG